MNYQIMQITKAKAPKGWKQIKLGDTFDKIQGGGTPSKKIIEYWQGKIPWASVKDIVTHNPNDTIDHISESGLKNSASRLVSKGTLIVPTRMALGHAVIFNVDVAINQDLKAIYPNKEKKKRYLQYWFQLKKKYIAKLGTGSTVDGISQDELKNINFLLPPLPEQEKIVEVLETWDKYLEKLAKVIKVKKKIKKGLMQKLLTGKVRLPRFSDRWEMTKLGEICEIISGSTPSTANSNYWNGDIHWITPTEITRIKGKYITDTKRKITKEGLKSCSAKILPPQSLVLCSRATVGDCAINLYEITTNQGFKNMIPKEKLLNIDFLYYWINTKRHYLKNISSGSTFLEFSKSDLAKTKIDLPPLPEQTAIANILEAADQEIETLERKHKLIEKQKKFLLNNLITGKIRLPEFINATKPLIP